MQGVSFQTVGFQNTLGLEVALTLKTYPKDPTTGRTNGRQGKQELIHAYTRWAPSYKWSYNPYKWPKIIGFAWGDFTPNLWSYGAHTYNWIRGAHLFLNPQIGEYTTQPTTITNTFDHKVSVSKAVCFTKAENVLNSSLDIQSQVVVYPTSGGGISNLRWWYIPKSENSSTKCRHSSRKMPSSKWSFQQSM